MKKFILLISTLCICIAGVFMLLAADHIDAPGVTGTSTDITDLYAFESPANADNLVFVCNTQGLLAPGSTADAGFDENNLLEFNIDNDGDYLEDLVIQCRIRKGILTVYGPVSPNTTGLSSTLVRSAEAATVAVTGYQDNPAIGTANGMSIFAGPRDDPFFMDFTRFGEILAGEATEFNNPGADTFAGTNVLSIVVEVPKSSLGGDALNVWLEGKVKTN